MIKITKDSKSHMFIITKVSDEGYNSCIFVKKEELLKLSSIITKLNFHKEDID